MYRTITRNIEDSNFVAVRLHTEPNGRDIHALNRELHNGLRRIDTRSLHMNNPEMHCEEHDASCNQGTYESANFAIAKYTGLAMGLTQGLIVEGKSSTVFLDMLCLKGQEKIAKQAIDKITENALKRIEIGPGPDAFSAKEIVLDLKEPEIAESMYQRIFNYSRDSMNSVNMHEPLSGEPCYFSNRNFEKMNFRAIEYSGQIHTIKFGILRGTNGLRLEVSGLEELSSQSEDLILRFASSPLKDYEDRIAITDVPIY